MSDSPADVGGLAKILAFRLRASRLALLKATADVLLSEYVGERAATAERIAQFYREPEYTELLRDYGSRHEDPRPSLIRELLREAGSAPERICDIGCGTADLGLLIAESVAREEHHAVHIIRLDINSDVVYGTETERVRTDDVKVTSHCADFFKPWPVPDYSQDLVVLAEVLEHAFDPEWLLREAKRVLRDNGLVLITVPNAWHWKKVLRFLFRQRLERTFLSDHIQHFSKQTLKELVSAQGFDILSISHFSLHSETPALFGWEAAKAAKRWLHRLYSKLPGCAWNYMVLARLRRTRESAEDPAVQVSGVMAFGREVQRMSGDEAVREALSQGLYLLGRALEEARAQKLDTARTVVGVLLCTLERVISVFEGPPPPTLESWLRRVDTSGWSKGIPGLPPSGSRPAGVASSSEWELVRCEAELVWS